MKKYILFILLTVMLLLPTTVVKAQYNKRPDIISVSNEKYKIKLLVFNPSDDTDIMYSGLPLKSYRIIPSRQYEGKSVSGDVVWENPEYVIVEGYQTVNIVFNCVENNEKVVVQVRIYGANNKETEDGGLKSQDNTGELQKLTGGIRDLNKKFSGIIGCEISDIFTEEDFIFKNETNDVVKGCLSFENFDNTKIGIQEIKWVFIPSDSLYETVIGYREIKLIEPDIIDEVTTPSLIAHSILLEDNLIYDINLNNKIKGSKYKWTSSNEEIVKVNTKNGLIVAVSEGEAIITCEITFPDNTTQILESLVVVGYDENAPILTETILDLEVGDKFNINLENKIAKSKYRWVSSDRNIVKVNSSNGKVTAVGIGEAYVTCTITADKQVIVLRCDINVTNTEDITE